MKILRRSESHGSILPSALGAIAAVPTEFLHHEMHGLRHPLSAYSTSIRLITAEWTKVFNLLERIKARYFLGEEDNTLLDVASAYAALLHRLNEHFDACYSVLRSLSPQEAKKTTLGHSQYLDNVKLVGWKQFKESTRDYRESHLGLIVNSIKHAQGELCPMYFHSDTEFRPGYYLRGILPGGVLGPDPRLHRGGNTAISFSRDMLMHIWWLYRISDLLSSTIASLLSVKHKHALLPSSFSLPEAQWANVVASCSKISPEFFPDEWRLPYPLVIYSQSPEQLSIEFPSAAGVHRMTGEAKVRVLATLDGTHLQEKVPYVGIEPVSNDRSVIKRL